MLGDLRERVEEASAAVLEETQAEGGKAFVPISIKLKLDLGSMAVEPSASVSFRRVIAGERFEIGDPNQPELNLEDGE
jgi:hypothetical protein